MGIRRKTQKTLEVPQPRLSAGHDYEPIAGPERDRQQFIDGFNLLTHDSGSYIPGATLHADEFGRIPLVKTTGDTIRIKHWAYRTKDGTYCIASQTHPFSEGEKGAKPKSGWVFRKTACVPDGEGNYFLHTTEKPLSEATGESLVADHVVGGQVRQFGNGVLLRDLFDGPGRLAQPLTSESGSVWNEAWSNPSPEEETCMHMVGDALTKLRETHMATTRESIGAIASTGAGYPGSGSFR